MAISLLMIRPGEFSIAEKFPLVGGFSMDDEISIENELRINYQFVDKLSMSAPLRKFPLVERILKRWWILSCLLNSW
jgi:hypothetical protein